MSDVDLSIRRPHLIRARWVVPMDGPPIRDGAVAIDEGVLHAVGPFKQLRQHHQFLKLTDFGDATLLPGLVNAHVHLELSSRLPGPRPSSFIEWLARLVPASSDDPQSLAEAVRHAVGVGISQCLKFGVTSVGDISRYCAITRPVLQSGPLRVVSYGEVLAMAQRRHLLEERLAAAQDPSLQTDFLRVAISPHAPYSVELDGYRRCLEVARSGGLPLAIHLAETADEAEFLAHHRGPFRQLWEAIGGWDDNVPSFTGGPIRFAQSIGLLDYPTLLAHVNYCDDDELALLATGRASVVYCPRTHAYFEHPPHRWQDMLAAGINVAVGTDSCASSPDLNLVDDLRLLHRLAPNVPASVLWEMATLRSARAIGASEQAGSLSAGKKADFVAFATITDDPLTEILEGDLLPLGTSIGGVRL